MDIGDHSDKPAIMATVTTVLREMELKLAEHFLTVFLPETCFLRVVARDFKLFYVLDTSDKPYRKNSFTDAVVQVVSKIAGSSGDACLQVASDGTTANRVIKYHMKSATIPTSTGH